MTQPIIAYGSRHPLDDERVKLWREIDRLKAESDELPHSYDDYGTLSRCALILRDTTLKACYGLAMLYYFSRLTMLEDETRLIADMDERELKHAEAKRRREDERRERAAKSVSRHLSRSDR